MSEQKERANRGTDKSRTEFFTVGPPLHAVRPGYITRSADDGLFHTILSGKDAYIFAQEHSGKTSLIAATAARLQANGYGVANLDLAQIGERDAGTDAGRWYYSIAYRLLRQLRIKVDLQEWWQDKSILSNRQRLFEFYIEVLLANTKTPIVVFIDELQSIEGLEIAQHLLESITAVNKARVTEPEFERLTFVLAGECDASLILANADSSPFLVMESVYLDNFQREATDVFASEFGLSEEDSKVALDRIYAWTNGQPYLTQKLARTVAREQVSGDIAAHVDRIVNNQFGMRASVAQEPHLAHIHQRIVSDRKNYESVLNLYGRVRKGIAVPFDLAVVSHRILASLGIIRQKPDGSIAISNRLYAFAFTARWANENLPLHWRGPAIAVGLLVLLTAIPFWYTQLLPRPYARILTSPTIDLETVTNAHRNLRSFPGHVETADRLFVNQLRSRSRETEDELGITLLAEFAAGVPGHDGLAEQLLAQFWDRKTADVLRHERRDDALLSSIRALALPTPKRRRVVQSLIGEDYPYLVGSVKAEAEQRLFNTEHKLLTAISGAQISQWTLGTDAPVVRTPWALSALEITPLLRRVITDRAGNVARIGLTVNVSHLRLDDLRMRLIAPSGRAVEIEFGQPSSSANESLRVSAAKLQHLLGEALSGTWTLSIRDEANGVSGHLVGWSLSLNSQVVEENFARGLDIPAPAERESDNLWFSEDGQFAIARAQQSDSARLWDLINQRATRTISVPASDRLLGVSGDASILVSAGQSTVNVWNARNGRRTSSIDVGVSTDMQLLNDGQHLLLRRASDVETTFELWQLEDGSQLASIVVAGSPALAVADTLGTHLAVADYDLSVRVWEFASGQLVSQLDLSAPPNDMQLAPGGDALAVKFASNGLSLWQTSQPDQPVLTRRGDDSWHFSFSPSGERFIAGSSRRGFQVYDTRTGRPNGPALASGQSSLAPELLAFDNSERVLVIADSAGTARVWALPADAGASSAPIDSVDTGRWRWRDRVDAVAVLAPGGQRMAVGDIEGHVHIGNVNAPRDSEAEELSFLGHSGPVTSLVFSEDAALVASAAADGTLRVWDSVSGLPRRYRVSTQSLPVSAMVFSPSGTYLAVMLGQRVQILSVESGRTIADQALLESHRDMAFGVDDRLYLASESGMLRSLAADRPGNWTLRNEWQGSHSLRQIEVSSTRQLMIIIDSQNIMQVLDIASGSIGAATLQLPDAVNDVLFTRNESQVLLRTSRWIHRADMSRRGVNWRSAVRAPGAIEGSKMVFASRAESSSADSPRQGALLMLKRQGEFLEPHPVDFSHSTGAISFGSREALLVEWQEKLGLQE